MRIIRSQTTIFIVSVLISLGAAFATGSSAEAAAPEGTWQTAIEVPGSAGLNAGGDADTRDVSCVSAGNCIADGTYQDASGNEQGFVVNQVNGTWQGAVQVPGTTLGSLVNSALCTSAGNCIAAGAYADPSNSDTGQAFVADDVNGTWQSAMTLPGTAALNAGGNAQVYSLSCASAGNCGAAGTYTDASGNTQAFVADEVNGTWQSAVEVPGTAALNTDGSAGITSMSCASAGNCSVGGSYYDASAHQQAFVADEVNGTWQSAVEVPGAAALNAGGNAQVTSVSCVSAGNCGAGGTYTDASDQQQGFVADEVNGTWQSAMQVPGTAGLNGSAVYSVSCVSAGNCGAGGYYTDASGTGQAFVVDEVNGTWQSAVQVPGAATLATGGSAEVTSVSCASAGNCSAGGTYKEADQFSQAFVVDEVNGTWQNAEEVPGTDALNVGGDAEVTSVSCASAGNCSAGGTYADTNHTWQAFVVSSTS